MKNSSVDGKSLRFLKLTFDSAKVGYDTKEFKSVRAGITKGITALGVSERRGAIRTLMTVCDTVGVKARVTQKADFVRIMTAASYWSYLSMAFAMTLTFDEPSRRSSWKEVEEISHMSMQDVAKISSFLDSIKT